MKYLCTSETLFATINKINEGIISGKNVIKYAEPAVTRSIKNLFFTPAAHPIVRVEPNVKETIPVEVKPQTPFTFEQPKTYPITPYKAPANTNSIVHTPPQELIIPGTNRKLLTGPKKETKNAIEPYKFEKIKTDPEPKPIVKPEPKPKVKETKAKFPFPFGGIDTPNRGAGSINEPASISDLPLNLRVDSIGSYATRQRM
jgi:hypothetical protein